MKNILNSFMKKIILLFLCFILPTALVGCGWGGAVSSGGGGSSAVTLSKVVLSDIKPESKPTAESLDKNLITSVQIVVGSTKQFYAYAVYSDKTVKSLSATEVKWVYKPKGLFTPKGLALSSTNSRQGVGQYNTFSISYDSKVSNTITVYLAASEIKNICISQKERSSVSDPCLGSSDSILIPKGSSKQVYVYVNYADNTFTNITNDQGVTWDLGQNGQILNVKNGLLTSQGSIGKTTIVAKYRSISSAGVSVTVTGASPKNICLRTTATALPSDHCLTATDPIAIPYGTSKQLYVYENFDDGSTINITNLDGVSWSLKQDINILNDIQNGLLTTNTNVPYAENESATVTASYASYTASVPVSISNAIPVDICLSDKVRASASDLCLSASDSISIPHGGSKQLYVYEDFSDKSTTDITSILHDENWSLGSSIINVNNGLVTSVTSGSSVGYSTSISVSYQGMSSAVVPVSIANPVIAKIVVTSEQESAVVSLADNIYVSATKSDGTDAGIISSSDPSLTLSVNSTDASITNGVMMVANGATESSVVVTATYKTPDGRTLSADINIPVEQKQLLLSWNPLLGLSNVGGLIAGDELSLVYNKYFPQNANKLYFGVYANWEDKSHLTWIPYTDVKLVSSNNAIMPVQNVTGLDLCYDYSLPTPKNNKQCVLVKPSTSVVGATGLSVTATYIPDTSISKTLNLTFTN